MHAERTGGAVKYGPYELTTSLLYGGLTIRRRDAPDRSVEVATIENLAQWDRFVAALKAGANEVAAVFAIDEEA